MPEKYDRLRRELREAATISSTAYLLSWDQETMMPPEAAATRAEQLALLSRLAHERVTSESLGELLEACESDAALREDATASANLREIRRDFDRSRRLPPEFVAEASETSSHSLQAWKDARRTDRFEDFAPWLERQLDLARRRADYLGHPDSDDPYDALLEDYAPGMTAARISALFEPLREALTPLIAEIRGSGHRIDDGPNRIELPVEAQRDFNRRILEAIGFDAQRGRLDISIHPFSSGIAPGDTRITTRYSRTHFADALGSTMHEAGHAMYEQGLPKAEHWGEPLAEPLGLGIHESQSRMWENQVGRSHAFWRWALPIAHEMLGDPVRHIDVDTMYAAVNRVEPNLIRVESDEATYNLHIMLRFDLERAMLRGDLKVSDLPGAWNDRIRADLGLDVPDDRRGCLQDIHWSMGSIGYFPTYTLGNLYSAQFWVAIRDALPGLEDQFSEGRFDRLLGWLRDNIHRRGRHTPAARLCVELTGNPLGPQALIDHLSTKLRPLYGL